MSTSGNQPRGEPVFIVGCARSGTSILGETVGAHPRVVYLYEVSPLWNRLYPGKDDDRLVEDDADDETAVAQAREEFRRLLVEGGGGILVEKNPKHALRIGFLDRVFPGCRVIHIIRDGRDTVASLMFRNRGSEWGHLRIPGWSELMARYPRENHIRCAHQWRDSVRIARDDGRRLSRGRYLEVRYENLVADAVASMSAVMEFQDETAGSYHARRQVRHFVDNHACRVGRWRENLSDAQVSDIMGICGDLVRELEGPEQ